MLQVRLFVCLLYFWLCTTGVNLIAQSQLRYETLTAEDGLSSNSIQFVFQDSYGFIWISTSNGLNRYDGYEIKAYLPVLNDTTSISGSLTTAIYEDKDRNIWVGTWSNGLNLFDRKTETFRRFIHNPADSTTISDNSFVGGQIMTEDHAGNFWVGTDNGINLLDRSNYTFTKVPIGTELRGKIPTTGQLRERAEPRAAMRIRGVYKDRQKNLWVGTDWGGLYRYDYDMKKFVGYFPDPQNPESIEHTTPGYFLEDESGHLWILNYWNGINKLNTSTGIFQRFPNDPHDPGTLNSNRPLNGFFYDQNTIYIGSGAGLFTLNTLLDTLQFVKPPNKDFEGYIEPLLKDKQGNHWFGTSKGILIVNNLPHGFQKYSHQEDNPKSIPANAVSIGVDSKGVVYITHSAGVDILDEKKQKVNTLSPDHSALHKFESDLNTVLEDKSGTIIFAGTQVFQIKPGKQHLEEWFPNAGYPTHGSTSDLLADAQNTIWFAGHCLAVYNPKYDEYDRYYPKGEGNFAANYIYSMLEVGPDQILLGGVWDGLIFFNTKERTFGKRYPIGEQNGLSGSSVGIYKIFRSQDQSIWIGSDYGLSLFDLKKGTYQHYGIQEGLPSNVVYNILEDDHRRLWLATANGLSRFDPSNKSFRNYDYLDGLQGNEFYQGHAAFKHPITKELWFLGPNGLTVFHPDSLKDNEYIPPVIFTKLVYYNRKKNNGQAIIDNTIHNKDLLRFSHSDNILEFHFAALNFVSPEKNTYAYRLTGFNDDWVNLGTRREVSFTNLNPGTYTLDIKAANNDGIWNEKGTSLKIYIAPPWWRTWWAYSLYGLAIILLLWRIHKYQQVRTIRKERETMHKRELEQAREIEKAYSDLKSTQAQLIQSEKMASLGELTAGIAHEIQNPLNFVNNFSEVNSELIAEMKLEAAAGNLDEVIAIANAINENEQKIIFHGKRADGIVKGMLQHSRISSGAKEPTDINELVDEYLRLAYHGLRAKDKSFNASINTDFDPAIGLISVVPEDIGRVILNLITNAFYAVNKNKTLSINSTPSYEPTIWVSTKKEGNTVVITIRDNGTGISQSIADKIFQPFFTTKPVGQGTGLGLSISYDIIKSHGGRIQVESKEGEGTHFIIHLPMT